MHFGSVCSGIEAASIAFAPLGWRAAWLAEIDKFASAVLAHHYPDVPNLGDMTTISRRVLTGEVSAPDVFCGGTPCQAFSVAGLRQSLDDARGNLTLKFVEIADAIDHVRTGRGEDECIVFWENVPGVLSTKDNAFGCFLGGLAGEDGPLEPPGGKWANAGAVYGPRRAIAWRTLDAQYFGVAQRRRRVFVVASARKGFDPAQVLFEFDGVRRDSAPSREARQVAPTIPSRSTAGGGLGTDFDIDGGVIQATTHTLRGEGFDASEDGTGRGTPLAPVAMINMQGSKGNAVAQADGPSFTLNAMHGHDMHAVAVPVGVTIHGTDPTVQKVASLDETAQCLRARTPGNIDNSSTTVVMQPVAFDTTQITSKANYSNPQPGDPCHPLAAGVHAPSIAYAVRTANTSANGHGIATEVTHTLDQAQGQCIAFPANLSATQCASTEELAPAMGAKNPTAVAFGISNQPTPKFAKELAPSLDAKASGGGRMEAVAYSTSLDANSPPPAVVFQERGRTGGPSLEIGGDVAYALTAPNGGGRAQERNVLTPAMQVRRLTPVECERLQGFPDGWTQIPWRKKPASECSDGPRYKALGNSWAVPNVRWIGQRIDAAVQRLR